MAVESQTLGPLLRRSRRQAGLTQEELAESAGVSVRSLSDIERGAQQRPHVSTLRRLADALGLPAEQRVLFLAATDDQYPEVARRRGVLAQMGGATGEGQSSTDGSGSPGTDRVFGTNGMRRGGQLEPPTVLTFLIADLRDYAAFTLEQGDEAAARLTCRFAELAAEVVASYDGRVVELRGDEALCAFRSVRNALRAAIALQACCSQATSSDPSLPLHVGIGLDTGEAIPVAGGYRGAALNVAARLCSIAAGGEVLVSETVANLARKMDGIAYSERAMVALKGFAEPRKILEVRQGSAPSVTGAATQAVERGRRPPPVGNFVGALPAGPLVDRQEELRRLLAAVDVVAAGEGRLVWLVGEPGVGKTRLTQEITFALQDRGFVLAAGSCYERRQPMPYYPLLDALATLYRAASPELRDCLPKRWPYLGQLLSEAGYPIGVPPRARGRTDQEYQERLFRDVTDFVLALAETASVALLLDDLQWADESSLHLLQHLARHTRNAPVLLLSTSRDVEFRRQAPLKRIARDLYRDGLLEQIRVRRLSQAGTRALVAVTLGEGNISDGLVDLVYHHTEGNPFFTQELVRALVERGEVFQQDERWDRREVAEFVIPDTIRSTIEDRLSRLDTQAQEVMSEASVLGATFCFDDLQETSGRDEQQIEAALMEAAAAGLVRAMPPDSYAFNHVLTQQTLYSNLSPRRRRGLHFRAGAALEALPERHRHRRAAELAGHYVRGRDPRRALPYALLAGDQAEAVFAHIEGQQYYRIAVELARDVGDCEQEARALEKLGDSLTLSGRLEKALEVMARVEESYRQIGDREGEARVVARAAYVHRSRGTAATWIGRVQSVLNSMDRAGIRRGAALLNVALANLFFAIGQRGEELAAAERAVDLARSLRDDGILADAEVRRGTALIALGREGEGIPVLEEAVRLAEVEGDAYLLGAALNNLATNLSARGDLIAASQYQRRALEVARERGVPLLAAFMTEEAGWISFLLGDWKGARTMVDEGMDRLLRLENAWPTPYALCQAGQIRLHTGQWKEGMVLLGEALALATRNQDWQAIALTESAAAEGDLLRGQPDSARNRLEPLLDADMPDPNLVAELLPRLAEARLDLGDEAGAAEALEQAIALDRAHDLRLHLGDALSMQGMLLTRREAWAEAERAFDEALLLARSMPCPYLEARTLYRLGVHSVHKGDMHEARRRLDAAKAIFQRLGAHPHVERTEQALNELDSA